jgi:hypothetical protein
VREVLPFCSFKGGRFVSLMLDVLSDLRCNLT